MKNALVIVTVLFIAGLAPFTARQVAAQEPGTPPAVTRQVTVTDSVALGSLRGETAARSQGTSQWVFGGFLGGMTLGPIGAGLAWTVANNSDVVVPVQRVILLTSQQSPAYVQAYEQAYAESLHSRRKRSALVGGAVGTAALAAILTAVWASYYYN